MRSLTLIPILFCLAGAAIAQPSQSSTTVRRTITTAPPQEDKAAGDASPANNASEAQIRAVIENYRRSWDGMNDRTRKMMLSHGGQTPEKFEHTVRQRMLGQSLEAPPTPAASIPGGKSADSNSSSHLNLDVLNTMSSSAEDLSGIRDGNVKRVQNGGCAPQINARITDLKGRLAMYEHVLHPDLPVEVSTSATLGKPVSHPSNAAAALANEWFTNRAETLTPAPASDAAKRQLDSVLGEGIPEAPLVKAANPNSDSAEQRKEAEIEMARIKPELERLTAACTAAR